MKTAALTSDEALGPWNRDALLPGARLAAPCLVKAHILMISDEGITKMFEHDEKGNSGWDVSAKALSSGGAGGTMALNIPLEWDRASDDCWMEEMYRDLRRAREKQGWDIHAIEEMDDLVEFARAFSRRHYTV